MKQTIGIIEKRLRISGSLILAGLLAELASMLWAHPTSFLVFLLLGGSLLLSGMLLFLYSLVAVDSSPSQKTRDQV